MLLFSRGSAEAEPHAHASCTCIHDAHVCTPERCRRLHSTAAGTHAPTDIGAPRLHSLVSWQSGTAARHEHMDSDYRTSSIRLRDGMTPRMRDWQT
mmetsp:Transcript_42539/g.85336  ORF Transcript_42539/g.85336 Transcript_42539/m.85336 type:complete len:96 (+) Transcript_42539:86-373(+)